jgi:hypothetical protein
MTSIHEGRDAGLTVVFHPVSHGMIDFDFILDGPVACERWPEDAKIESGGDPPEKPGVSVRARMADSSCAFPFIVRWLEAVTGGVQECACYWDGEGPDGELHWGGAWESGSLRIGWTTEQFVYRAFLRKADMVRAIYQSFREFVESDRYDPLAYEQLSAGEAFELVLESPDLGEVADALASRSRADGKALVHSMLDLAYAKDLGYPRRATLAQFLERAAQYQSDEEDVEHWIPSEWDEWSVTQRRRFVVDEIYRGDPGLAYGSKLRELRSPLVEKWLAEHEQAGSQTSGSDV